MRWPRRGVAAIAALTVVSGGCSFARSGETRESAKAPADQRVGDGVLLPSTTTEVVRNPAAGPGDGADDGASTVDEGPASSGSTGFAIAVRGPDGRPRPGVPAAITGTISGTATSDIDGVLRFEAPAGRYVATIEPTCTDTVQVETGARATIAVPEGEVVRGELRVAARRRHFPGAPVTYEANQKTPATERSGRQWKLGVTYLVRFTMRDRCGEGVSPGASVEGLRFVSDGAVETRLQKAETAGPDGTAVVAAICQAEAEEIELFAEDGGNPTDRVDLFSRALLDDTAPNCVR